MKPIFYVYLVVILLVSVSCNPKSTINMLTVINADGSCEKEFQNGVNWRFMMGDTAQNGTTFFPVSIDTSVWKVSWQYKGGEVYTHFPLKDLDCQMLKIDTTQSSADFQLKIRKHFKSLEDMSPFSTFSQWNGEKIRYKLEKKFRWFYTYYTYSEIYPKMRLDADLVPISTYFTDDEAAYWFNGMPDLTRGMNGLEVNELNKNLEEKYNRWFAHILWNEYYKIYVENYDKLKLPLSPTEFTMLSDTLFAAKGQAMLEDEKFEMDKVLDKHFHTNTFSEFAAKNDSLFHYSEEKLIREDLFFSKVLYNYSLQLPGKVLSGNFYAEKEGILYWRVTSTRMFLQDYVIEAQSRKANGWAFAVTLLVLVAAVGSYFFPKKKIG